MTHQGGGNPYGRPGYASHAGGPEMPATSGPDARERWAPWWALAIAVLVALAMLGVIAYGMSLIATDGATDGGHLDGINGFFGALFVALAAIPLIAAVAYVVRRTLWQFWFMLVLTAGELVFVGWMWFFG